ncbi:MAG: RNA-binding protein [Fuerstiella sp.]
MTQIFVGNLPFDAGEEDLRSAFERFGRVTSVRVMSDSATNRSRGFGFVSMPAFDDAEEAIRHMSGASLKGRQLTVNEAQSSGDRGNRNATRPGGNSAASAAAMAMFAALQNE